MASRERRNSAVDAIHNVMPSSSISPAQLYSTDSGHLYHAGRMVIVLVGLPARGKTHHAVALTRYLRWLGVKTHAFHLGDYRRSIAPPGYKIPDDYFISDACEETVKFRQKVIDTCLKDIDDFFTTGKGQVAIYDAVNATAKGRRDLFARFKQMNIEVLFVECLVTDKDLVARNIRDVKISSPDYQGMDPEQAVAQYLRGIELRIPEYETMSEPELTYVKLVNVTEKFIINSGEKHLGYLFNRIIFFLMNSRIKVGSVFFARAGLPIGPDGTAATANIYDVKADNPLSEEGKRYAQKLRDTLWKRIEHRKAKVKEHDKSIGDLDVKLDQFLISDVDQAKRRSMSEQEAMKTTTDYFNDADAGSVGDVKKLEAHRVNAPENPSVLAQKDISNRMMSQVKATREYLKSLGASEIDTVSTPPVTSGTSTPLSPADALAISTIRAGELNQSDKSNLVIWCSTRLRTMQTCQVFCNEVSKIVQRPQLNQLNTGEANGLTPQQIKEKFPDQYSAYAKDPYHHRYQRGESYQDVALRLEPLILEMEGHSGDLLIVAHESVLRVLYGYLMACSVPDIPYLKFPLNELVEIIPNAYINQAIRIPIEGVAP